MDKEVSYFKIKIVLTSLFVVAVPLIVLFTLASYTYNDGQRLVMQHLDQGDISSFVELQPSEKTIPVISDSKYWLSRDRRVYYYKTTTADGNKYYFVDPKSGNVVQLKEDYWGEK